MPYTRILRRLTVLAAVTLVPLAGGLPVVFAQSITQASFELRPYCAELNNAGSNAAPDMMGGFAGDIPDIPGIVNPASDGGFVGSSADCPSFAIQSPAMQKTPTLKQGDILDLHLVLNNPQRLPVSRLRSWLVYDPAVLRGDTLELGDAMPVPTPGESEFSAQDGYAKIGASAASGNEPAGDPIVVAHLKFTILATPYASTVISFYDAQGTDEGHTYAITTGSNNDILASSLPSILVELDQTAAEPPVIASAASSVAVSSVSSLPSSSSSTALITSAVSSSDQASVSSFVFADEQSPISTLLPSPTFSLLQPQNLRVTTEGGAVYLAWDPLPSGELVGYNLYYGTVSGNYLQKRSIDRSATNLTLRGLPEGQTYYFALRGANGRSEETQFGQETAVTIGNPSTSTAPLSASIFTNPGPKGRPPATSGQIGGETGLPSTLLLLTLLSASIGTLFAFRRQWTAAARLSA